MPIFILGISSFYHDSAAAILKDGVVLAAAQEERFTRIKHDAAFPKNAINYCLENAGISPNDVSYVVYYEKPLLKFERLLETYLSKAPRGIRSFTKAMPVWLKEKLFLKRLLLKELESLGMAKKSINSSLLFTQHHQSHAASAFFPSPFEEAAVLCLDGVGEWATTSCWTGVGNHLDLNWTIDFPHSLGLLYSAFTHYCGFKVNSGEYKLMGLAPYGSPVHAKTIYSELVDVKNDGSFHLNMKYFDYEVGLKMTNQKFHKLFDRAPREPESNPDRLDMDLASSIQLVTEDIILKLAKRAREESNKSNLCMAGGVALNCVANGKLKQSKLFDRIFIQPAAGDAGGAIGSALAVWHEYLQRNRAPATNDWSCQNGTYLGPEFSDDSIATQLIECGARFSACSNSEHIRLVAEQIALGSVVGWFHGRMEFGPRALGSRSILADPRDPKMQSKLNLKIKYRESFRPFAPAILAEDASDWFEIDGDSPYMMLTCKARKKELLPNPAYNPTHPLESKRLSSSATPATTHVDGSSRVQTVHRETNPQFWLLINEFKRATGCPMIINTSFNIRGEPIVCTPKDAYNCFMKTEMDFLSIGQFWLSKTEQQVNHEIHQPPDTRFLD